MWHYVAICVALAAALFPEATEPGENFSSDRTRYGRVLCPRNIILNLETRVRDESYQWHIFAHVTNMLHILLASHYRVARARSLKATTAAFCMHCAGIRCKLASIEHLSRSCPYTCNHPENLEILQHCDGCVQFFPPASSHVQKRTWNPGRRSSTSAICR
ncbi:hypothetical protein C8R43DRAFT_521654 [Mycena crocata]|nr:hypothetical protein C8R43DRAFT_521654 [Mycena crocata]